MKILIILFMAFILLSGELLTNGDFEDSLKVGWTKASYGSGVFITRNTAYQPDPDYEVYLYKPTGSGYAKIYQAIDIPSTNLNFKADLKLYAYDNSASAWAATACILSYLNTSNGVLGETRICMRSSGCPWTNTSTLHLIDAANTNWNQYNFNIGDELTNLPGVDPAQIKKIRVTLLDTVYHPGG